MSPDQNPLRDRAKALPAAAGEGFHPIALSKAHFFTAAARAVSDQTLLLAGCLVTFIACAGTYLGLREGFSYGRSAERARVARRSETTEIVAVKQHVVGVK